MINIKIGKVEFVYSGDKSNNNGSVDEFLIQFATLYLKEHGYLDSPIHNNFVDNTTKKCYNKNNNNKGG